MYAGGGPFLVKRADGRVAMCGSAYPPEWRRPVVVVVKRSGGRAVRGEVRVVRSGQAARRVAHEIGVLTALSSGTDVPFLPEIVASSLTP